MAALNNGLAPAPPVPGEVSASTMIVAINARTLKLNSGPKPQAGATRTPAFEANAATPTMKEARQ